MGVAVAEEAEAIAVAEEVVVSMLIMLHHLQLAMMVSSLHLVENSCYIII